MWTTRWELESRRMQHQTKMLIHEQSQFLAYEIQQGFLFQTKHKMLLVTVTVLKIQEHIWYSLFSLS